MSRIAFFTCVLLGMFVSVCAVSGDQISPNPESLRWRIKNDGASAVIKSLWGTSAWSDLVGKLASGDPDWIDVAVALSKGSDAGATEGLEDALFLGLAKNPVYELQVLPTENSDRSPLSLSTVCGGRTDPPSTYSEAITELKKIEAAVQQVRVNTLESKKQYCLTKLKADEVNLKRFFAVPG